MATARSDLSQRVGWGHGRVALSANLLGASFVFVYLSFVAPMEAVSGEPEGWVVDAITFGVFMAVSVPLVGWLGYRQYRTRLAWLDDGRVPTADEQVATARLPVSLAARSLAAWVAAALFFAALSIVAGHSWTHAAKIGLVIVDGGLVSGAIEALLTERKLRPILALALAGQTPTRPAVVGVRARLLLTWLIGSGVPLAGLVLLPLAARYADERTEIDAAVLVMSVVALLVGSLVTVAAAKSVAEPIEEVRTALERVRAGDLGVTVSVNDAGEIGLLQAGVNRMVEGLRERQRLADLFGRHVGTEVARLALEQGSGLQSEQREASALFVDLVGSTAMAEVLQPEQVVATLNAFFGSVVRVAAAEGGWVNKFEGDGALCIFGAPATQPDHAARALRAARAMHRALGDLAHDHPGLDAAIGVSSGPLVAGNVGTEARYEYTVIGRPVNEAARLSDLAKGRPGRVLASVGAVERAGDETNRWASLGTVGLRGQAAPTAIFEPVEVRQPVS